MSLRLSTPASGLPGIGDKAALDLAGIGIKTIRDLLWYVPFRYDDFSRHVQIAKAPIDTPITIDARIKSIGLRASTSSRVKIVDAVIEDGSGELKVIWFNQPYLLKTLPVGSKHSFAGLIDHRFGKTFSNPIHEPVGQNVNTGRIVPVYGLSGGLTMRKLRDAIQRSLTIVDTLSDWLPSEIVEDKSMPTLATALASVHFPNSHEELNRGIDRLKFDELFLHQMLFEEVRRDRKTKTATVIPIDEVSTKTFVSTLPFTLTRAQKVAAWEILQDLAKPVPMNRLLEGDVGSGKTVVAAIAVQAADRSVYLAPTEILATQQHKAFCKMMSSRNIALLTHNQIYFNSEKVKRAELVEKISNGEVDCLIGTHAVLQEGIDLSRTSLVIIDEQHRFGVAQRHALLERDPHHAPHLLSMTATPIPRSLALTIYGDLELSILDELPKGRKPIGTAMVPVEQRVGMWKHVRSEIEQGRQVFVICPLIDPSDSLGSKSVTDVEKMLSKDILKGLRIVTLHGKLKSDEKQKRNEDFRDGKIDVLVSTTVVEVGVDVPNATVMVIMSAERFGLAQLHQLRGRVGRSDLQSYCYLLPDDLNPHSNNRLQAVVESQNGFELAERDLELRGAGNVFGNAQSGFPDFQFATSADVPLMKQARDWAQKLLLDKDFFETHPLVRARIEEALEQIHLE
ncbi:MAG: ATP-dependent DNA helicase RecG [Candidatus Uhrbacteria bacterium]|nr:ATP-dependent DNA helicase RecG [Candidatus Uhrbacteria bacterium]